MRNRQYNFVLALVFIMKNLLTLSAFVGSLKKGLCFLDVKQISEFKFQIEQNLPFLGYQWLELFALSLQYKPTKWGAEDV